MSLKDKESKPIVHIATDEKFIDTAYEIYENTLPGRNCFVILHSSSTDEVEYLSKKNNYYIHHLNLINDVWSDAKFILLVRDGRDVACSYKEINKLDTDSPYKPDLPDQIGDIAKDWVLNNAKVLKFFENLPESKYYIIRYEEIISSTEESLNNLTSFLGVNFDKSMLSYYKTSKENEIEPSKTLDWKRKTLRKPDSSNIGKYSKQLSKQDILLFERIASKYLKKFRYE